MPLVVFSKQYVLLSLTISCCLIVGILPLRAQNDTGYASAWDSSLPGVELHNLRLNSSTLKEAWNELSQRWLIRSVLLVSGDTQTETPFVFKADRVTAGELMDKLVVTYSDYTWTQDQRSGVVWVYPSRLPFEQVLPSVQTVQNDQYGIPMQTGVLESLAKNPANNIVPKEWGTLFLNTFEYPVDIPRGQYSTRDILNLCCTANPTKSFFLQLTDEGTTKVTAFNLITDTIATPTSGALHLWKTGLETPGPPTIEELKKALASRDPFVRSIGGAYLESVIWNTPVEEIVTDTNNGELGLWTTVGLLKIIVRTEEGTFTSGIARLEAELKGDLFEKGDPQLALLTAFELARLTENTEGLDRISARTFSENDLMAIRSDLHRIARASKAVRDKIRQLGPDWLIFSEQILKQFESGDSIFGEPGPKGKSDGPSPKGDILEINEQAPPQEDKGPSLMEQAEEPESKDSGQDIGSTAAKGSDTHSLSRLTIAIGVITAFSILIFLISRRKRAE